MRLRLMRFTVRSMMIAVAVLAAVFAAFAAWMQVDQYEWRRHLNTELRWSGSPVGEFVLMDGERYRVNGILKVSAPGVSKQGGYYFRHRLCVDQGGELYRDTRCHSFYGTAIARGKWLLTAANLAEVEQIISKLPPANASYPQGDLILVSSLSDGSWVTRAYDIAALPPAVKELVRVLQLRLAMTHQSELLRRSVAY
jgi:hypothetical protein